MTLRIAIFADIERAFGRLFSNIKKHLEAASYEGKYQIDRFDWSKPWSENAFDSYDLVYTCDFVNAENVRRMYNISRDKLCWGPHFIVGFWISSITTLQKSSTNEILLGNVEHKAFPSELIEWINTSNMPVGCISKQLMRVIAFNQVKPQLMHTRCGVPDEIVDSYKYRLTCAHPRPKVILQNSPVTVTEVHGYDMKRLGLIAILKERLIGMVDFVWPSHLMSHSELDLWYDREKGDVCLCTAHTEGNPLGLIEGIGRGLVPISTRCGVADEIIINGVNGFLIDATSHEDVVSQMEVILKKLSNSMLQLQEMKKRAWKTADKEWRWSVTSESWAEFFDECKRSKVV